MKKTGFIIALCVATMATTSCSDLLDLSPIDNYGSETYWKTEVQVDAYMVGLHQQLLSMSEQHILTFGELRGGHYKDGTSADGMATAYGDIRLQNLSSDVPGVEKYGNIYGCITNINLFIARVTDADFVEEAKKNYYLGQAYGLRAFYYYDLYRTYGGVPLRLGVEVIDGELDPTKLYLAQSTPSETMAQIKADLSKSLEYFGDNNAFDAYFNAKVYWSKAATECLAGDVYLWNSKVTIGDNEASADDLAVAKQHLLSVVNNYSLSLQTDFASVFSTTNEANSEIIVACDFKEGEVTNTLPYKYTYALATGSTNSNSKRADGTAWDDLLEIQSNGQQSLEYNIKLYERFDDEDTRRDATFAASYRLNESGELYIYGTHVRKNIGSINAQAVRIYDGNAILYRLPWVYLALAEVANMEGDNANVETYINLVRARAYGDAAADHTFTASDFKTNEVAILHEKDKEFVQEGQRWWDLLRMTNAKGGTPLVFCPEGGIDDVTPVLDQATEAHEVLWPIDQDQLNNDPSLEQTPGYESSATVETPES